jgi:hypothetical protein
VIRTLPIAALLLAGCSSSLQGGGMVSSAPLPSYTPPSTSAADVNQGVCDDVQNYMADTVKPTFQGWDVQRDEFSPRVARALRNEATKLYSLSDSATGATLTAVEHEAAGLVDLSIAVESQDDAMVGSASNRASASLAELRGVCGF